ncbi:TetR/AcrR family transcriptional regulator [Brevundimonas diminuta]|uniref:TetR/AcrR family transcriptional regulator n=1 Tax=Brevundimonas diminuta TaxID=293 RepID=UPI003208A58E
MSADDADRLLDAAEALFYARGYQAVGMDEIRAASGLPLKRIYALFKGKDALAVAMLDRRDDRWHAALVAHVARETAPNQRVLAVFHWLENWLKGPGHRGCAWTNAFGELGGVSPAITEAARRHKARFRAYLADLAAQADATAVSATLYLLAEGYMVTTGIGGPAAFTGNIKDTAQRLLPSPASPGSL